MRRHLQAMYDGDGVAPPYPDLKFKPKTRRTCYKINVNTGHDELIFGLPLVWHYAEVGMKEYAKIIGVSRYTTGGWARIAPGIYSVHHLVCHEYAHLIVRRREFAKKTVLSAQTIPRYSPPHGQLFRTELRRILRKYDPHLNDNALFTIYRWAFDAKGLPYVSEYPGQ